MKARILSLMLSPVGWLMLLPGGYQDGGIFVMKARQFKFGVHCDTGEVWHQGSTACVRAVGQNPFAKCEKKQNAWRYRRMSTLYFILYTL